MSESRIQDLDQIFSVSPQDHFVLEHDNSAYNLTGQDLVRYLIKAADKNGVLSVHVGPDQPQSTQTIWLDTSGGPNSPVLRVRAGERWNAIEAMKGDPGKLISQVIDYQAGPSGVERPSGEWLPEIPAVRKGEYLWTRVTLRFNSGAPVVAYFSAYQGMDGRGTVQAVGGVYPGPDGNVPLTPEKIGAQKAGSYATTDQLAEKISAPQNAAVGDSLVVKLVSPSGVPTDWETRSEGKWELLKAISVNSTKPITETDWNLRAILLNSEIGTYSGGMPYFKIMGTDGQEIQSIGAGLSGMHRICTLQPDHGKWVCKYSEDIKAPYASGPVMLAGGFNGLFEKDVVSNISGFNITGLPAGSTIKVWGIKA